MYLHILLFIALSQQSFVCVCFITHIKAEWSSFLKALVNNVCTCFLRIKMYQIDDHDDDRHFVSL